MNQIVEFFKLNPVDTQIFYFGYFLETESYKEFAIETGKIIEYLVNLPFSEQYYVLKALVFLSYLDNAFILNFLETFAFDAIIDILKNPQNHAKYTLQIIDRKA